MTVGIINYGMGNLLSVANAVEMLGETAHICDNPADLHRYDRLILPGVGAFGDCMHNLTTTGFTASLNQQVLEQKIPILGICLGLQVMADSGEESRDENGQPVKGLGWIPGNVVRLSVADDLTLRVPHVGWNTIETTENHFLFSGLPAKADFYFVHSYHLQCRDNRHRLATCDYGGMVTAAVGYKNIIATQFHPEKSQTHGLTVLNNFLQWNPTV